jgi:hypothetical protein
MENHKDLKTEEISKPSEYKKEFINANRNSFKKEFKPINAHNIITVKTI